MQNSKPFMEINKIDSLDVRSNIYTTSFYTKLQFQN